MDLIINIMDAFFFQLVYVIPFLTLGAFMIFFILNLVYKNESPFKQSVLDTLIITLFGLGGSLLLLLVAELSGDSTIMMILTIILYVVGMKDVFALYKRDDLDKSAFIRKSLHRLFVVPMFVTTPILILMAIF